MTTREELVALRDWIREPDDAEEFSLADVVDWINRRPVAEIERLASRQEVSVEESDLRSWLLERGKLTVSEVARALLAEYSITKRE